MELFGIEIEPWMGLAIVGILMVVVCIIGLVTYKIINVKNEKESLASLPEGTDQSDIARMLQDKYKAEREDGTFKRNLE